MNTKTDDTGAHDLDQSRLTHLVGYASTRASITMRRVFARHFGPLDLKVVEFSILMLVASNPQVNQKRLGTALDISPPNMAVTLDRMVEPVGSSGCAAPKTGAPSRSTSRRRGLNWCSVPRRSPRRWNKPPCVCFRLQSVRC